MGFQLVLALLIFGSWGFTESNHQVVNKQHSISTNSFAELQQRVEDSPDTLFVLNYWATWCAPCVAELPLFDKLQGSQLPVKVLLVSLDFGDDVIPKLKRFAGEKGIHSEIILLDESNPNDWLGKVSEAWSGALPATSIIYQADNWFKEGVVTLEEIQTIINTFMKS